LAGHNVKIKTMMCRTPRGFLFPVRLLTFVRSTAIVHTIALFVIEVRLVTSSIIKFGVSNSTLTFIADEGLDYHGSMPADPAVLRRELTALAARQAGYFTSGQAREVGYSYPAQTYHVERGNWRKVRRGIFRVPDWPAGEDDAYVLWSLWSGGRAVFSHQTALALHDLGDVSPVRIHVTVPPRFRASDSALVLHKAPVGPADVEDHGGYQVTTVERAILDAAAGDMPQEQLQGAVSDALRRRLVPPGRLRARSDGFGDRAALRIERALNAEETS
jgi:hypothetical protein